MLGLILPNFNPGKWFETKNTFQIGYKAAIAELLTALTSLSHIQTSDRQKAESPIVRMIK